ncbi:hypothetical protein RB195_005031 [Necator americanus]|uniref:Uncharacterized protein n=1 Tax=Necator americanus TaxID=51031 RepID=A0ABR1BKV5_NECAM
MDGTSSGDEDDRRPKATFRCANVSALPARNEADVGRESGQNAQRKDCAPTSSHLLAFDEFVSGSLFRWWWWLLWKVVVSRTMKFEEVVLPKKVHINDFNDVFKYGYLHGREKFNLNGMDIDIIGEICVKRPCSSRAATSEAVH